MTKREQIESILDSMNPSDAIALIEKIGKQRRKFNSMRISKGGIKNVIDADRPDLINLKKK
jgi:hypothetical protein